MSLNLDKQSLVNISLGGLAGIVTAVASASFIISAEFSDLKRMQQDLPKMEQKVSFLECREKEIKASLEHMATTMEQIAIIADQATGNIQTRAAPQIRKLLSWTSTTDCNS